MLEPKEEEEPTRDTAYQQNENWHNQHPKNKESINLSQMYKHIKIYWQDAIYVLTVFIRCMHTKLQLAIA